MYTKKTVLFTLHRLCIVAYISYSLYFIYL